MDKQTTRAILRRFPEGDLIALFPDIDEGRGLVSSYQTIGQHGGASRDLTRETLPVDPAAADAVALLAELARIGYRIKLMRRMPPAR